MLGEQGVRACEHGRGFPLAPASFGVAFFGGRVCRVALGVQESRPPLLRDSRWLLCAQALRAVAANYKPVLRLTTCHALPCCNLATGEMCFSGCLMITLWF